MFGRFLHIGEYFGDAGATVPGYREPEDPATLFLTEDARPMELLVEYRKIDNIGLIHKPYLVDYQTDKVKKTSLVL